jgi:Tfp pilus assembly protein PilO
MSARDRIVVAALVVVAALAGFWFAVLGPKRKEAAAAGAEVTAQQQKLDEARQLLANAEGAKRRFAKDYAEVARLGKAVPADDNVASLVFQLQSLTKTAKVRFSSIKLGTSAASPAGAAASSGTDASGTAAASQVAASSLPPGAVVGDAGLATLPFSFIFEGSYLDLQRFLAKVDEYVQVRGDDVLVSGRLLTIDGVSLTHAADKAGKVKATVAATAYLAPDEAAAAASAAGATTDGSTPSASTGTSNTTTALRAGPAS